MKDYFHQWMRRRVEEYGFDEPTDFCTNMCKTGGRPRKDYLLTVGMAKEPTDFLTQKVKTGGRPRKDYLLTVGMAKEPDGFLRLLWGHPRKREFSTSLNLC